MQDGLREAHLDMGMQQGGAADAHWDECRRVGGVLSLEMQEQLEGAIDERRMDQCRGRVFGQFGRRRQGGADDGHRIGAGGIRNAPRFSHRAEGRPVFQPDLLRHAIVNLRRDRFIGPGKGETGCRAGLGTGVARCQAASGVNPPGVVAQALLALDREVSMYRVEHEPDHLTVVGAERQRGPYLEIDDLAVRLGIDCVRGGERHFHVRRGG